MEGSIQGRGVAVGSLNNPKYHDKVIPNATIAIGDILYITGQSGNFQTVALADADTEAHLSGQLLVAHSKGISGEPMRASRFGVMPMVTTGAAVGDPVYLSATAGGKSLTIAGVGRRIGTVIKVGAIAVGKVLIDGTPELREIVLADPGNAGAIPVTHLRAVVKVTTAGAETRTIAAPTVEGQELTCYTTVDGGTCVYTIASTFNVAGNNTLTCAEAGDYFKLKAINLGGTKRWVIVENDSAAASTV